MPRTHVVQQGECISSIAEANGFSIGAIWNEPANEALRTLRGDPFILLPGDEVTIPDQVPKQVSCPTGKRHVFRRLDIPEIFRLEILDYGKPRAEVEYIFAVDDKAWEGKTDAEGRLAEWIPSNAERVVVTLADGESYAFDVGAMDPVSMPSGVAARLVNLGFLADPGDDNACVQAVWDFQKAHQLEPTGVVDETTRATIAKVHRS